MPMCVIARLLGRVGCRPAVGGADHAGEGISGGWEIERAEHVRSRGPSRERAHVPVLCRANCLVPGGMSGVLHVKTSYGSHVCRADCCRGRAHPTGMRHAHAHCRMRHAMAHIAHGPHGHARMPTGRKRTPTATRHGN